MEMSPGGFEPPAFRLGGERSILLSYGDIYDKSILSILLLQRKTEKGIAQISMQNLPVPGARYGP